MVEKEAQTMVLFVNPLAAAWCKQLSSRSREKPAEIGKRVIYRGLTRLNGNGKVNGVPLFDRQPSTTLEPIDVLVPPKLQERLRGVTASFELDPENGQDVQTVAAHLVLLAYLQANLPDQQQIFPHKHTLNYADRNRLLFEQPKRVRQEQYEEDLAARRRAISRVAKKILGNGSTNTNHTVIFGQTAGSSLVDLTKQATNVSTRNNGRFTAKEPSYPFEIDPEELKEFEEKPSFSPNEIKEHREALGLSQKALAARLNLERRRVSDAENKRAGLRLLEILTHGIRLLESHPELIQRKSGPV